MLVNMSLAAFARSSLRQPWQALGNFARAWVGHVSRVVAFFEYTRCAFPWAKIQLHDFMEFFFEQVSLKRSESLQSNTIKLRGQNGDHGIGGIHAPWRCESNASQ